MPGGKPAAGLVLVGNIGGSLWPAFSAWRKQSPEGNQPNPLDRWSKDMLLPVAGRCGATAFFPSDAPWQPFQQWAMRAEGLQSSPTGILIHPRYGLWHGYRGALAFETVPEDFPSEASACISPHPCDTCMEKPCLHACPANAILPQGFQYDPCRNFMAGNKGTPCLDLGCRARDACPVGATYRYGPEQIRFHMAALDLPSP